MTSDKYEWLLPALDLAKESVGNRLKQIQDEANQSHDEDTVAAVERMLAAKYGIAVDAQPLKDTIEQISMIQVERPEEVDNASERSESRNESHAGDADGEIGDRFCDIPWRVHLNEFIRLLLDEGQSHFDRDAEHLRLIATRHTLVDTSDDAMRADYDAAGTMEAFFDDQGRLRAVFDADGKLVETVDAKHTPPPALDAATEAGVLKSILSQLNAIQDRIASDCLGEHSDDFRSLRWDATLYNFTANQAPVIRVLYDHYRRGAPDVGDQTLLHAVDPEAPPARLDTLFRNHPAWKTIIVPGRSRGTHRLSNPNK